MRKQMAQSVEAVERGEDLIPCFIGFNRRNEAFMIGTPWDDEEDKVRALFYVKMFFAWKEVDSYLQVSEAWTVTRELGSTDTRAPADCPERQEVIVVNGVNRAGAVGLHAKIARDGKMVACSDPEWAGNGDMTGRMTDLLPPEGMGPPPPHVEERLKVIFANFPQGGA